jgi:hypothetical protein
MTKPLKTLKKVSSSSSPVGNFKKTAMPLPTLLIAAWTAFVHALPANSFHQLPL